jgi:hypothetical protein
VIYGKHIHEAVKRARDDQGAVPVEMHGGHVVEMGVQRFGAFPCVELATPAAGKAPKARARRTLGCVPYPDVAVASSRYELRTFAVIVDAEYVASMSFEDFTGQALPQQRRGLSTETFSCIFRRIVHTESTSHIRMV